MKKYLDYYNDFKIKDIEDTFDGSFKTGINACIELCDRHAKNDPNKIALFYEGINGESEEVTFLKLKEESARIANFLTSQGIKEGEIISTLLPRTPELLYVVLGAWRAGVIYQPLFTAFGPDAIEQRLETSQAKLVFTDEVNYSKLLKVKIKPTAIVFKRDESFSIPSNAIDYKEVIPKQSIDFAPVLRGGEETFMLLSTSGTTGLPKGVPIPLRGLNAMKLYMDLAVDLRSDDRFWNIADPGWAYGLYYSITGPLINGNALMFYEGGFTAEDTYRLIKKYKITNLAGSPTAFRLLIGAGNKMANEIKGQLRRVSSAGEALNPEVIRWFKEELGTPICDHYGQTETGMMVNNHHALEHKINPGSMGFPMPGFQIAILDEDGKLAPANTPGILSVDIKNSPSLWFSGYYKKETPAIENGFYRTGDTAEMAEDGLITYVGRSDDVITSSGYRIGPFDVENSLIEHPSVLEVAVVGKPDPKRTEIVKAFVVLNKGYEASDDLKEELSLFVKDRLAAHAYPREIEFIEALPKTPSGKVQRFILRSMDK